MLANYTKGARELYNWKINAASTRVTFYIHLIDLVCHKQRTTCLSMREYKLVCSYLGIAWVRFK